MSTKFSQFALGTIVRNTDILVGLRDGVNTQYTLETGLQDDNGRYLIGWTSTALAVNYVNVTNAAASGAPTIAAIGTDTNIDLNISAKGSGHVDFTGTGAIGLPAGTTLQQPTGFLGGFRYNTTTNLPEYWKVDDNAWTDILDGSIQTINGTTPISAATVGDTTTISLDVPLAVEYGGTENTAFTANMPVCGGTTSTGAMQSVDPTGAVNGYALTFVSSMTPPIWAPSSTPGYTITQASHGFSVGEALYLNSTVYELANADATVTAEVVGVVSNVIDANTFVLTTVGRISGLSGLTPGVVGWLSDATPGLVTETKPTTVDHVEKPVWIADTATTAYVYQERGKIIPSPQFPGFSWIDNDASIELDPYNGYLNNGAGLITYSTPASPQVGDYYAVQGASNTSGWVIQLQGAQVLTVGTASTSAGGTLTSDEDTDGLFLVYAATNLFIGYSVQGNPVTA